MGEEKLDESLDAKGHGNSPSSQIVQLDHDQDPPWNRAKHREDIGEKSLALDDGLLGEGRRTREISLERVVDDKERGDRTLTFLMTDSSSGVAVFISITEPAFC